MVRQDNGNLLFKRLFMTRANLVSTQRNEVTMILAHTAATTNTNTLSKIQDSPTAPEKTGFWQTMAKWFWDYTEETGKADTRSFEGLL